MREETEKMIWQRVQAKGSLSAEQALLPERLSVLFTQEEVSAAACHQLSARLSGADSSALRRSAAQAENRIRQLNALYFLLSGLRASRKPPNVPFYSDLCEALREECLLLLSLQEQYLKAAKEFPAHADTMEDLAAQVRKSFHAVTDTLQHCLPYSKGRP